MDGQTGAKLQGAEFSIYKDNVEYVGSYTTNPNGGIKTWNDNNDAAGARPSSIKLHLFANGNVIVYTLSEDEVYREAADRNDALIAEVGQRFYEQAEKKDLYAEDGQHPNEAGSRLAAETIAAVIAANQENKKTAAVRLEILEKVGDNDLCIFLTNTSFICKYITKAKSRQNKENSQ